MNQVNLEHYQAFMRALSLIETGLTKTHACDQAGISARVYDAVAKSNPDFTRMAEEAQERGYDTLADRLLKLDSDLDYGSSDPKVLAVQAKSIQWYLTKRAKNYNPTITVNTHVTADKAIIDALNRGLDRAKALTSPDIIDVTPNASVVDMSFVKL